MSDSDSESDSPKLYTWEQIEKNEDVQKYLQTVYGLDVSSAEKLKKPASYMPWKIRTLLKDVLCPHKNSKKDLFKPFSTDEGSPTQSFISDQLKILVEYLKKNFGKSRQHNVVMTAWLTHCKKDLQNAYEDISKRVSSEKQYVVGNVLAANTLAEFQKDVVRGEDNAQKAKEEEIKKKEESESSSSESDEGDEKKLTEEQGNAIKLGIPEELPSVAASIPASLNSYKDLDQDSLRNHQQEQMVDEEPAVTSLEEIEPIDHNTAIDVDEALEEAATSLEALVEQAQIEKKKTTTMNPSFSSTNLKRTTTQRLITSYSPSSQQQSSFNRLQTPSSSQMLYTKNKPVIMTEDNNLDEDLYNSARSHEFDLLSEVGDDREDAGINLGSYEKNITTANKRGPPQSTGDNPFKKMRGGPSHLRPGDDGQPRESPDDTSSKIGENAPPSRYQGGGVPFSARISGKV